jgi:hypothetical protein
VYHTLYILETVLSLSCKIREYPEEPEGRACSKASKGTPEGKTLKTGEKYAMLRVIYHKHMEYRMSLALFFGTPEWGHTNPSLPLVAELVRRGDQVLYYSLEEFQLAFRQAGGYMRAADEVQLFKQRYALV